MTWTALTYAFESPLTAAKMTQQFNNLTAFANGDSGAPNIINASLADTSIDGSKLSDTERAYITGQVVANGATYTPASGLVYLARITAAAPSYWEAFMQSAWRSTGGVTRDGGCILTDGTNWRWKNASGGNITVELTWI